MSALMEQVIDGIRRQNPSITKQLFGTFSACIQLSETKCGSLTSDCVEVGKLNDRIVIRAIQLATLG
jgi:hypothetical protein